MNAQTHPDWLVFHQRDFPSANMVLIRGSRPVLVDTGFGSDVTQTEALLRESGVPPERLALLVNTHYHADHAGGNSALQSRYDLPIAAHRWEAEAVNQRDPEACSSHWLRQPIEPYTVQRSLQDSDVIDAGDRELRVIHTPGHTLGHISLYADGVLIAGDTFHADDVAWLNVFREGTGAIYRMLETLDRLAALPLRWSFSGHGPACAQPLAAIDTARRRYERWIREPEKIGWHACKRIFVYALMLFDGLPESQITPYLLDCPWYQDYCRHVFHTTPEAFIQPFLQELRRSNAAVWREGWLLPSAPYQAPEPTWMARMPQPANWERD